MCALNGMGRESRGSQSAVVCLHVDFKFVFCGCVDLIVKVFLFLWLDTVPMQWSKVSDEIRLEHSTRTRRNAYPLNFET